MTLIVHHLRLSQSERIVWLCEELGIDYVLKVYDRSPPMQMAPPEYKALHPLGTAPVITDGAVVLAETGAIVDYIVMKHGGGRLTLPPDDPAFADWLFWLHVANGTFVASEMVVLIVQSIGMDGGMANALGERSANVLALAEERLGAATWFAGDAFTTADIMMVFPLTTMRMFTQRDLAPYPNILAYLARIGARPAYRRAMAAGDPELTPMLG
ncbi:glutathione S-transferase family protein [uncultured Sphingomonas sp.]|uniref:glutathione S-transferase family protein n=1 Tax=uncultured Sphingomonas sp. TaxID=158754 RepID=UPI0035C987CF